MAPASSTLKRPAAAGKTPPLKRARAIAADERAVMTQVKRSDSNLTSDDDKDVLTAVGKCKPSSATAKADKKDKVISEETAAKKGLCDWLRNNEKDGCRMKADAEAMRMAYGALKDPDEQSRFAKKFLDTKQSKDFGWIKTWDENKSASVEVEDKVGENYLNRSRVVSIMEATSHIDLFTGVFMEKIYRYV